MKRLTDLIRGKKAKRETPREKKAEPEPAPVSHETNAEQPKPPKPPDGTLGRTKLTEKEQMMVIRRIALYERPEDISNWCRQTLQKQIGIQQVYSYRRSAKWRPIIEKLRQEFEAEIADVPMASKRNRVQRLNDIHERLFTKEQYELAAKQLVRIHDELEGKSQDGRPNIFITQFNQLSDEEIEERRLKLLDDLTRIRQLKKENIANGVRTEETQKTSGQLIEIEAEPITDETETTERGEDEIE